MPQEILRNSEGVAAYRRAGTQLFEGCVFEKMRCLVPGLRKRNPGLELANAFSRYSDGSLGSEPDLMILCTTLVGATLGAPRESRRERITKLVVQIQRADYESDRVALGRLYQDLVPFVDERHWLAIC